jgi:exosortase
LGVSLVIAVGIVLYWPTAAAYSAAWTDFDNTTTTHGYLIALMCITLLILRREDLVEPVPPASPAAYMTLAALSVAWVVVFRASILTAHELLLPIILWSAIYAVFGKAVARNCLFPIGFLYFALPFWAAINHYLQMLTIAAERVILPLLGVPVQFEGDLVHIPEGTFAIEGGCSGLHFFVVGLAIAAYYGALHRDSARHRVLLLVLVAVLALLANWIRVSVIIIAGQVTHMQSYLVRVSHYGFGWAVFAVAMAVFFMLAARIPSPAATARAPPRAMSAAHLWPPGRRIAAAFTAAALGPVLSWVAIRADSTALIAPPAAATVRGWSGPITASNIWKPVFIGADSEQLSTYRRGNAEVAWYQADYAFQRQGKKLLGYDNSIVGANGLTVVRQETVTHDARPFAELKLQDAAGAQSLLWYAYQVGSRQIASGLGAQLWYGMRSLPKSVESRILAFRAECTPNCAAAREQLALFVDGICEGASASRFSNCRRDP